jgi:hypothetical protein
MPVTTKLVPLDPVPLLALPAADVPLEELLTYVPVAPEFPPATFIKGEIELAVPSLATAPPPPTTTV